MSAASSSSASSSNPIEPVGQYESFPDYLEALKAGEGKRYERSKVAFARRICPLLTKENIASTLELGDRMDDVCERIRGWNHL